jgi:hypothetical protein
LARAAFLDLQVNGCKEATPVMQTDSLFLGNTVQELVSIALKLQEQVSFPLNWFSVSSLTSFFDNVEHLCSSIYVK